MKRKSQFFHLREKTCVVDNPFSTIFVDNLPEWIAKTNADCHEHDPICMILLDHAEWTNYPHRLDHVEIQLISVDFAKQKKTERQIFISKKILYTNKLNDSVKFSIWSWILI